MPEFTDPGALSFDADIVRADETGAAAFVAFPYSVPEIFGVKGRVPVTARFDDQVDYRGSLVTYGDGHLIIVRSDVQHALCKAAGDRVHVTITLDTSIRTVDLDPDVERAFAAAGVMQQFRSMSYSHQREYHQWITEAKRPETRERRVVKAIDMIGDGKGMR